MKSHNLFLMALTIILCLMSFTGCANNSVDVSNTNAPHPNESNTKDIESIATQILPGMTYAEVRSLIGTDGTDIGYGAILYEWSFQSGEKLHVWFSKPEATNATLPDDLIVTNSRIEGAEK